jgi:asparagine synthase (glutamine-hydrolysing)
MCGIVGVISRSALAAGDRDNVLRMNALQRHRGPDGEGHFSAPQVMLAMRRLSIIDLNTGWQPLYSEDRQIVLVANGEIYNHVALRQELRNRGHQFATGSDCETVIHAYEEFGDAFVEHLRGMYAFALWDARRERLLLGRDRMGEKPLYLAERGDATFFCSELRPLVAGGIVARELDPVAVNEYLHYGYVPEPLCILKGVRKLPAAHLLIIDGARGARQERRYWRMEDAPPLDGDPIRLIREQLEDGAALIAQADVPVGVALSGGMDASAITALACSARHRDLHAFTIGYSGRPWQDERGDAQAFARHLGIPFHSMELSPADFIEQYPIVNRQRDDPIADIAGVAIAAVARLARQHSVPVLLFGHGGDELFWGYQWVRSALRATHRREALAAGLSGFASYLKLVPPPLSVSLGVQWAMSGAGILNEWQQFQDDRTAPPGRLVFYDRQPYFRSAMRRLSSDFYAEGFAATLGQPDVTAGFRRDRDGSPPEVALIRLICETYLMENGIAQCDRLAMAASVESRLPLVDHRLIETVIGLHKGQPGAVALEPKQWLRSAVSDLLPDFVLNRRKTGFSPPWRQWGEALAAHYGTQLLDGYLVQNGVIPAQVARQLHEELVPRISGTGILATLTLGLENWCRQLPGKHA